MVSCTGPTALLAPLLSSSSATPNSRRTPQSSRALSDSSAQPIVLHSNPDRSQPSPSGIVQLHLTQSSIHSLTQSSAIIRCAALRFNSLLTTNHCDRSGSIPLKKFTLPEHSITGQRASSSTRTTASLRRRSTSRTPLTRFTTRFVASSQEPQRPIVATSIARTRAPVTLCDRASFVRRKPHGKTQYLATFYFVELASSIFCPPCIAWSNVQRLCRIRADRTVATLPSSSNDLKHNSPFFI